MSRKLRRSKEELEQAKGFIKEEEEKVQNSLISIAKNTGGALSNLKINTPAFRKWATDLQAINPAIGHKDIRPAPEYNVESKIVEEEMMDMSDEMFRNLMETGEYNPNIDNEKELQDLSQSPKSDDSHDNDFIDQSIVENLTKDMFDELDEMIAEEAVNKIKDYHQNPDYQVKIDVPEIIENYREVLRIANPGNPKYLK